MDKVPTIAIFLTRNQSIHNPCMTAVMRESNDEFFSSSITTCVNQSAIYLLNEQEVSPPIWPVKNYLHLAFAVLVNILVIIQGINVDVKGRS